jgi:RNA polymerase sigma-70 factor (ECF subfamily)
MSAYMPPPDTALLELARAGDADARGRLLESYRPYLTLLARVQVGRLLRGKVSASDAVQEAFLGAHRDFAQFQGGMAELSSWLRQVLASALANLVRRFAGTQARDPRLEVRLADGLDQSSAALVKGLVDLSPGPEDEAGRREQAALLAEALESLPAEDRDVLVLRHLEGLSFPEVADRMGRSLDSVKKRWPRALMRLRRAFRGDEP